MIMFLAARRDGAASRARILAAVQADPGLHISLVAERTGLSWHTTMYHLKLLERRRLVQVDKGGRERRAFPAGLPAVHRTWLAAMRLAEAGDVLRLLLRDPRQSIPGLSRRMGHSEKVVRRQMAHLAEAGLVHRRGQMRPVYEVSRAAAPELAEWLRSRRPGDGVEERRLDEGEIFE
jgi:predicted transcriptional regulator